MGMGHFWLILNGWSIYGLNGWGIYGLNRWGIYDLKWVGHYGSDVVK